MLLQKPKFTTKYSARELCFELLWSIPTGVLVGPFAAFLFMGGMAHPILFWEKISTFFWYFIWISVVTSTYWAFFFTFATTLIRHYIIPYLFDQFEGFKAWFFTILSGIIVPIITIAIIYFLIQLSFGNKVGGIDQYINIAGFGAVFGAIITVMIAYAHIRQLHILEIEKAKSELTMEKTKSELMNLHLRIRPHFFFNSMNTLSALIDRDKEDAQEFLADLCDLFRKSFTHGHNESTVSWDEELALLENYLQVEKTRFPNKLSWDIDVDAPETAPFPPFLLQPIVENAIHHGVSHIKNPSNG